MEINHDDLPVLGTKAAAVAAIESLIFRAIGAKDLEPLQLRYWLDAYYQARFAAEREAQEEERLRIDWRDLVRADEGIGPYKVEGIREEDVDRGQELAELLHKTLREAAEKAGLQVEDDGADVENGRQDGGPMRASAPTVETEYSAAPEDAAETQQTEEPAAKPQRQRSVGWTDGFESYKPKKESPASKAAAAFKREQFERLRAIRAGGVTMPQILEEANGAITEDQLLAILESRRVPVAVYRVLEAALDRIETE